MHIPDPEAHVMPDGRVYVYGSWDRHDDSYCSNSYRVISSADLIDWTDHGISFTSSQVPWLLDPNKKVYPKVDWDWENPTPFMQGIINRYLNNEKSENPVQQPALDTDADHLFAPDAIYKDDKYYLYFCAQDDSEGVAIAERPEGPFSSPVQLPCGGIDPAVFIDDDGQAYYYWGQLRASGARLKSNMTELEEDSIANRIVTEEEHGFHEGSSVRKRNGIYYYVYSSINSGKATTLAYATSLSPLGPFTYRGIIIDNEGCDPRTWNNHGSIEEVNGKWYVFYHRSSRNLKNRRRLCIEPIFFTMEGAIPQVAMTSQGAGLPFRSGEIIDAYRACQLSGHVFIGPMNGEDEGLKGIGNGDSAIFRYVDWKKPVRTVAIEGAGSGEIIVYLDDKPEEAGRVLFHEGKIISSSFVSQTGKHEIKLKFFNPCELEIRSICFSC